MSKDLLKAIKLIEQEKGIAEDILVEAIGTNEHDGRVWGIGEGVDMRLFFGP